MKHNWEALELEYVSGLASLVDMAGRADTPALSTLELRCAERGWVEKRRKFRERVAQRVTETALDEVVEIRTQHLRKGRREKLETYQ